MFKKLGMVWASVMMLVLLVTPAAAQTDSESFLVNWYLWNSCAEETVHVTGNVHWVVQSLDDGSGGYHYRFHENRQNVVGQGLSTGAEYRVPGSGHNLYRFAGDNGATTQTEVHQTHFIAAGQSENTLLQITWHFTFNPDGDVIVEVADSQLKCN